MALMPVRCFSCGRPIKELAFTKFLETSNSVRDFLKKHRITGCCAIRYLCANTHIMDGIAHFRYGKEQELPPKRSELKRLEPVREPLRDPVREPVHGTRVLLRNVTTDDCPLAGVPVPPAPREDVVPDRPTRSWSPPNATWNHLPTAMSPPLDSRSVPESDTVSPIPSAGTAFVSIHNGIHPVSLRSISPPRMPPRKRARHA